MSPRKHKLPARDRFAKFMRSQRGSISVLTVLTMVPFLIGATAALDMANAVRIKASLQAAADAGVLAAATALASGHPDAKKKQIAEETFYANLSPKMLASFSGSVKTAVSFPEKQVHMSVQVGTRPLLTSLITDTVTMGVEATAAVDKGLPLCILVLNHTAWKAFDLQGTTDVDAVGCAVHVNSSDIEGMRQTGSGTATADAFCVHGNYSGTNYSPKPRPHCMREQDPLEEQFAADKSAVDLTSCRTDTPLIVVKDITLSPGVYCGGLSVIKGVVTLEPGLHVFRGGELSIQASGTLQGAGVTILLTGSSTTRIDNLAGANLILSPPTSGYFAGITIAHDPASIPTQNNVIRGGGHLSIEGILYFPKQPLTISGSGVIGADTPQFAIVADTLSLEGNGLLRLEFGSEFTATGLPQPEVSEVIRLVK
jgi:Flp pilus assembly protein TadG